MRSRGGSRKALLAAGVGMTLVMTGCAATTEGPMSSPVLGLGASPVLQPGQPDAVSTHGSALGTVPRSGRSAGTAVPDGLDASFAIAFTASPARGSGASSRPVAPGRDAGPAIHAAGRPTGIEDGQRLSSAEVLALLRRADRDAGADGSSSSLFGPSTLSIVFDDHGTGERRAIRLATCDALDFESGGAAPFTQQTVCDGALYAYGVGPNGLQITRDRAVVMQLPLEPGAYALNGVPFRIAGN